MASQRKDRGIASLGVIAPIVAAIIGGGTAIVAATQIVSLAPHSGEASSTSSTSSPGADVQYGDR